MSRLLQPAHRTGVCNQVSYVPFALVREIKRQKRTTTYRRMVQEGDTRVLRHMCRSVGGRVPLKADDHGFVRMPLDRGKQALAECCVALQSAFTPKSTNTQ
jgi:hypothetical protein